MSVALDRGAVEVLKELSVDAAQSNYDKVTPERHLDPSAYHAAWLIWVRPLRSEVGPELREVIDGVGPKGLEKRFLEWYMDRAALVTSDPHQLEARASSLMNEVRRHLDEVHRTAGDPELVGDYALALMSAVKGVAMDLRDAEGRNRGIVPAIWRLEGHLRDHSDRDLRGDLTEAGRQRDVVQWAREGLTNLDAPPNASPELRDELENLKSEGENLQKAYKGLSKTFSSKGPGKSGSQAKAADALAGQLERALRAVQQVRVKSGAHELLAARIERTERRLAAAGSSLADMLRQMNAAG
jgi:hypothetical protein